MSRRPFPAAEAAGRCDRRHAGFTLVELITVVVVLGILAAVALPRFSGLQGSARAAKAEAVAGAMRAAAGQTKSAAIAASISCDTATVGAGVTLEGQPIDLNHCYPQAIDGTDGILGAAAVDPVRDGLIASGGGASPGSALTLQVTGARTPASCQITYASPASADAQPTVAVATGGC